MTSTLEETPTLAPSVDNRHQQNSLLQNTQPYYRSKAFVSEIGINPLVAATAPIFFLVEKFQQASMVPNLDTLRDDLTHEIKAFENHAQTHGYPSQVVLAAKYILCLWADETISHTRWGKNGKWLEHPLTDNKHQTPEKSFFTLLDHCLQETGTYIDLLELFYLCLSLGYEGEYRERERGHMLLSELKDNLYHRIQHYRGEVPGELEIIAPKTKPPKIKRSTRPMIVAAVSITLLVATTVGYFVMNQSLTYQMESINNDLNGRTL